ncbi:MAG: TlpA family protein disulfide reductase [Candidatus Dormibacteraeota bacterium]|nr:TlpA family protein disulfide reductase [Candidatus Dormibacteraeota bacterium]
MTLTNSQMRLAGWAGGGLLVAALVGLLGFGLAHPDPSPGDAAARRIVPNLTVRTFDGDVVELSGLRGTPVVINFWASWCEPCRQEAPALAEVAQSEPAVRFIGVAIQDEEVSARRFRAQFNPPYPVGLAIHGSYLAFGVTGPPETYFVDRKGVIRSHFVGPLEVTSLRRRLELIR